MKLSAHDVLRVRLCTRPECEDEAIGQTGLCARHARDLQAQATPAQATLDALRERRKAHRAQARPIRPRPATGTRPPPRSREPRVPTANTLTRREDEIISMAAWGLGNPTIATSLGVSLETVRWHLKRAYVRLGVRTRADAIAAWRNLGNRCPACGRTYDRETL